MRKTIVPSSSENDQVSSSSSYEVSCGRLLGVGVAIGLDYIMAPQCFSAN